MPRAREMRAEDTIFYQNEETSAKAVVEAFNGAPPKDEGEPIENGDPSQNETVEAVERSIDDFDIYERLSLIQNEMKVPKNLYNSFGKYYYRNAETILETAKPICKKYHCTLLVEDIPLPIGVYQYIKAIAKLIAWGSGEIVEVAAYAREPAQKKGMDDSQVTGATSSYARKYALNGLFNLDDNKDADTDEVQNIANNAEKKETKAKPEKARNDPPNGANVAELAVNLKKAESALKAIGVDIHDETVKEYVCSKANVNDIDGGKLLLRPADGERVLAVYREIYAIRTRTGA